MQLAHLALSTLGLAALAVAQSNVSLDWIPFNRTQFDGNAALNTDGTVQLFWRLGEEYTTFGIASQSSGYLALGFSATGAMTGADMAVGLRGDNGSFVFENRHAAGFVTPQVSQDQTNNMRLIEGDQENGITYFIFEKKNKADCLTRQNDVFTDSWQWFIYAHSDQNTFAQHGPSNMGKEYVKLGTGNTVSVLDARPVNNTQEFIVLQPEVTIPPEETTYCYSLHKMPAGRKNFLVGERPVASSPLLHHLVLYACYVPADQLTDLLDKEPNCDWETYSNPCIGFVTEWAPGMSARTFEDGYGKPFGSDFYEYAMLETHYNNPELLVGETDAASYKFIYTDEQVGTEIGTLTLGNMQVNGWFMEPGKELVPVTTICTPECTDKWPAEGITAVSVFHHMHFRGRNMRVQIVRNGTEIAPLSTIRDFDYGYQFSKALDNVQLLPGDQLITTCEFNTMNDTAPVPGGQPSSSEMCFAWVDYYPLNSVLGCTQVDPGLSDPSQPHAAVGMCLVSTAPEPELYASTAFTTPFQQLPVIGDNCTSDALSVPGASGAAILNTCPETDVCFSLNVPEQSQSSGSGDIYFQLSAPTTYAWVALAQGTMMSNANIFLMHSSADGSNVTLSPRSTTGHVMPTHNDAADITLLEGSGISNGRMTANVRCSNCSTWSTGSMSLQDTSSDWVYAHQRGPAINSDDMNVAITQHDTEGGFQWDLSRATGGPDANPFLATGANTTTSSSSAGGAHSQTGMAQAHGAMASIAFVAIFPSGAILVRLASLPGLAWIHGGLQIFGYAVFIAAAGLGIFMANRDDYLQEPHAIIGILLLAVLFFMPIVGTIHHKMFKKVQKRTMWSYGHIFTGRIGIVLGMVNGGLGLQLANAESAYTIAYGVFAGLMGAGYISVIVFAELKRAKGSSKTSGTFGSDEGKRLDRQGSGSGSDQ
ncbi:hypothetical protein LTR56_022077 [Elasticomyces elasticus]|nr:hypothetical protein LTR56_022077 [Elasticomyces elasticus]KAK3629593.1 hypothetical protein LTR22_021870 [Elasticomyces elasticus]KAK4919711.1 hypothetical protein LTR49_012614 [Elasticomyces elasticus]KAK5758468.1 hypothetical protein LTS12_011490 [Elasticomyces elasticus]